METTIKVLPDGTPMIHGVNVNVDEFKQHESFEDLLADPRPVFGHLEGAKKQAAYFELAEFLKLHNPNVKHEFGSGQAIPIVNEESPAEKPE